MGDHALPLSVLSINLDSLVRNYLLLKKKVQNGTDVAAVVKANAYGLGIDKLAPILHTQGCRHFFVGHVDEGVDLRAALAGSDAAIYVLNGPYGAAPADFARHGLTPVLNTLEDVSFWAASSPEKKPVIIHTDTGMNRLGLTEKETATLAADPALLEKLDIRFLMSHLACADEPAHVKNAEQLAAFRARVKMFARPLRLSLANSAGIFLGSDYHFDLARPGCFLYGINPQSGLGNQAACVATLKARILQVRTLTKGETVGYGATYTVTAPIKAATISVGYADGYLRSLTGAGHVVIGGMKCPVLGRVSMDLITVDLSALPTAPSVGDWAEILGETQTVDDMAIDAGTIGYEILTSLGVRYKKIYTGVT